MRILLLGNRGQLGWELKRSLAPLGEVKGLDQPEIDLADAAALRRALQAERPEVVINAAAYTAVDQAEAEAEAAGRVNTQAPGVMAEEARRLGAALIHYSTDYVFDGAAGRPYTEADAPRPLNAYGRTKLEGELAVQAAGGAHLILRTSWVYSLRRRSFPTQVLNWARTQETVRVAADQVGSPTWCRMLAEATAALLARAAPDPVDWIGERSGVYHLAGRGSASRLAWAEAVLRLDPRREEQVARRVLPARSEDFLLPALRPAFSALDCARFHHTFGFELPPWEEALALALAGD